MGYVKRAEYLTILSFAIRFMCLAALFRCQEFPPAKSPLEGASRGLFLRTLKPRSFQPPGMIKPASAGISRGNLARVWASFCQEFSALASTRRSLRFKFF